MQQLEAEASNARRILAFNIAVLQLTPIQKAPLFIQKYRAIPRLSKSSWPQPMNLGPLKMSPLGHLATG